MVRHLIIESLNLEDIGIKDIDAEEPLFVDGLGLDSIDALELGVALQKKYGFKIKTHEEDMKKHFFSVRTLARFIQEMQQTTAHT